MHGGGDGGRLSQPFESGPFMQLIAGNAIVYTKTATSGKAAILRRDLATGAESQVAQLPADPRGSKTWTPDGSLEVYATQGKAINDYSGWVPIHLWSNGADHVIYSIVGGVGGIESRWSVVPVVEFSPTRTYVAISDSMYSIRSSQVRILRWPTLTDTSWGMQHMAGPGWAMTGSCGPPVMEC